MPDRRQSACMLLLLLTCLAARPVRGGEIALGWVWDIDAASQGPAPYQPREGDILLLTAKAPVQTLGYLLVRTGHPLHSGIVVRRIDGTLAVLESGGDRENTTVWPLASRLARHKCQYDESVIWVRRIRRELTPCESDRLTAFAEMQHGKPFVSDLRFVPMVIPGRPARPSSAGQQKWFCSEIVYQAAVSAGLLELPISAGSTVPTDLFYNRRIDLNPLWGPSEEWTPHARLPDKRPALAPRTRG
ncbi:MAG: hypothetical protein RIC55_11435 [Pirellulaceae bacterium]